MQNRAEEASYYFAEPVRRAFEALRQPMAVCQALDEKTRALLASDSLLRLVGRTREDLMQGFSGAMFRNVRPESGAPGKR